MSQVLSHSSVPQSAHSSRQNNTFKSSIFETAPVKQTIHKTNLGHRKDHATLDFFGDAKMEAVKKPR